MRLFSLISIIILVGNQGFAKILKRNVANPPEKIRLLERIESSKWLNSSSKWLLKNHSMNLIKKQEVELLSTFDKEKLLTESEIGTASVLLLEFATGEGPSTRYFTKEDSFAQSFIKSPGMRWMLNQYANQYDSLSTFDSTLNLYNYRYQFSPVLQPFDLTSWDFSLTQHFETWDSKNMSQIFLGSFNADIQCVNDTTLQIHAWNKTSKKSLFLGLGNRWQRPLPLGTIDQHFLLELSIEEIRQLSYFPSEP